MLQHQLLFFILLSFLWHNINNLVNIILDYLNTLNLNYDNLDQDDKLDADNWWLD